MTIALTVSGVMLIAAAIITAYRLLAGPNSLDRLAAVDTIIALTVCGVMVWSVYTRDTTLVPSIVALSVVGFVGSVSIARFRVADTPETARASAAAAARSAHPPIESGSIDRRKEAS